MLGTVVTVYELHAGEDEDGSQPFTGLDEGTVTAALEACPVVDGKWLCVDCLVVYASVPGLQIKITLTWM